MKICAIVAEFNPFHNGHKYLIEQAKIKSGCDAVLCVMSGNFVQRCEPAVFDKSVRVKSALLCGADIVVELPVLYSTANAECFARGAVEIINRIKNVTHIAFGCENDNIDVIQKLAEIRAEESEDFKNNLKKFLSEGLPYPSAHAKATVIEAEKRGIDNTMSDKILKQPNNLLAIEYCKQLIKQKTNIESIAILRKGADHHDSEIRGNFASAQSIREKIKSGEIADITHTVPTEILDLIMSVKQIPNGQLFKELALYSLKTKEPSHLFDAGEGIEIKLRKNALELPSLDDVINSTKTKRYSHVRLNRLCLQSLLGIYKNSLFSDPSIPVRLLGIKKDLKKNISDICDSFIIKNEDLSRIASTHKEYIRTEETAAAVYSQISKSENTMYKSKLIEM